MRPSIGIDVGGTTSRAGLVDASDRVMDCVRFATPGALAAFCEAIASPIAAWDSKYQCKPDIGLALPGLIDSTRGNVVRSVNLPWLEDQPLCDLIEAKSTRRPVLMTDADAATWGEYLAAGSPDVPLAHLRLGTGVACGMVVRGKLIPTDPARRTHWPALVIEDGKGAPPCPCGLRGCLEVSAGGNAILRKAQAVGFADLSSLNQGLEADQQRAARVVDEAALSVCRAIVNLAELHHVATIVIGGGVIAAVPRLFEHIREAVAKSACPHVRVMAVKLGDDAGVIGAARLACVRPGPRRTSNIDGKSTGQYGTMEDHGA